MRNINLDIWHTYDVMKKIKSSKYNKVYFHSNEYLKYIFQDIDVKDKSVFSVLSSGDHPFYSCLNGAKTLDVFDSNRLTLYYFYLRIWVIKFMNTYYPLECFDGSYLDKLLSQVKPNTYEEAAALEFWKKFKKTFHSSLYRKMFFIGLYNDINNIEDVSILKDKLDDLTFDFYNVDISQEGFKHDKKYDIVFASNINDYVQHDSHSLNVFSDNLSSLLNKDGKVVISNVKRDRITHAEKNIFLKKFDIEDMSKREIYGNYSSLGYVLCKK